MPPAPGMPATWSDAGAADAVALTRDGGAASLANLAALIDAAAEANPDVAIAAERVRQAEAHGPRRRASLFPAVNFGAGTGGARRAVGRRLERQQFVRCGLV